MKIDIDDQSRDMKNGCGYIFGGLTAPLSWALQFICDLRRLWSSISSHINFFHDDARVNLTFENTRSDYSEIG